MITITFNQYEQWLVQSTINDELQDPHIFTTSQAANEYVDDALMQWTQTITAVCFWDIWEIVENVPKWHRSTSTPEPKPIPLVIP